MKKIFIIPILLLSLCYIHAQDLSYNSVQFGWGIGNLMRQDLTISPFIHRDWSPLNAYLTYARCKKLEHQVKVRFSLYDPMRASSYAFTSFYNGESYTIPHNFKLLNIDYALGKKFLTDAKWSLVAGGKSRNFIYASEYYFGESGPSPITISFGVDIWMKAQYQFNEKSYISSDISLPVFSYVYRNPYLVQDEEYLEIIYSHNGWKEFGQRVADGEFRSWGDAQRVELNIQYGYIINPRWEVGLGYLFSMDLNQNPTPFTQVENTFFISGKIKF